MHDYIVEKPKIVKQPEDRSVASGKTNVNLTVTAEGTDMKFKWLKHGEHRDDDKAISQDDDQYCMTETVIVKEYKIAVLFFHLYHDTVHTSLFCMFLSQPQRTCAKT